MEHSYSVGKTDRNGKKKGPNGRNKVHQIVIATNPLLEEIAENMTASTPDWGDVEVSYADRLSSLGREPNPQEFLTLAAQSYVSEWLRSASSFYDGRVRRETSHEGGSPTEIMIVDDLPVVVRIRLGEYRAPRNGTRNLGAYPAAATRNVQFLQSIDPKKADQFLDPFARFHNRTDLGYVVVTSPVNIRHDVEKEIKEFKREGGIIIRMPYDRMSFFDIAKQALGYRPKEKSRR